MLQYIGRRVLLLIPSLFILYTLLFLMVRVIPGDIVDLYMEGGTHRSGEELEEARSALRQDLGLDHAIPVQYGLALKGIVQGDLGNSLRSRQPVTDEIIRRAPITMELAVLASITALLVAIPAGVISAVVKGRKVKVRLTDPTSMEWDVRLPSNGRDLHLQTLNTGVPHAVGFVEDLEGCDVVEVGRYVRHHARFQPAGTNMNFAKVMERGRIAIRTYERGVEDETLACGTGAVASALASTELGFTDSPVDVVTRSGEVLQISFQKEGDRYSEVHMEGETTLVYEGSLNEEAWE